MWAYAGENRFKIYWGNGCRSAFFLLDLKFELSSVTTTLADREEDKKQRGLQIYLKKWKRLGSLYVFIAKYDVKPGQVHLYSSGHIMVIDSLSLKGRLALLMVVLYFFFFSIY